MADIIWEWDGDAMVPLPRFTKQANDEYVVGYKYVLTAETPEDQRSRAAHARFFATIKDTYWMNLPERYQFEPWAASPQFLRHRALIETGWFVPDEYVCASHAEAMRWLTMLPPPTDKDGKPVYYQRTVAGSVLVQRRPRSQAYRSMKKAEFQQSCADVEGFLDELIGVRLGESAA